MVRIIRQTFCSHLRPGVFRNKRLVQTKIETEAKQKTENLSQVPRQFHDEEKARNSEKPNFRILNVSGIFCLMGVASGLLITLLSPKDMNGFHCAFPYAFHTSDKTHTMNLSPSAKEHQMNLMAEYRLKNGQNNNGAQWQALNEANRIQKEMDDMGCLAFSAGMGVFTMLTGFIWFQRSITYRLRRKQFNDRELYEVLDKLKRAFKKNMFFGTFGISIATLTALYGLIYFSFIYESSFLSNEYVDNSLIEYNNDYYETSLNMATKDAYMDKVTIIEKETFNELTPDSPIIKKNSSNENAALTVKESLKQKYEKQHEMYDIHINKLKEKYVWDWNMLLANKNIPWNECNDIEKQMRRNAGYEIAMSSVAASSVIIVPIVAAGCYASLYNRRLLWNHAQKRILARLSQQNTMKK